MRVLDDAQLLADTPHARLLRDTLRSGAMREVFLERVVEAYLALYVTENTTPEKKRKRAEAYTQLAGTAIDILLRQLDLLPPDQGLRLLDEAQARLTVRRQNLISRAMA